VPTLHNAASPATIAGKNLTPRRVPTKIIGLGTPQGCSAAPRGPVLPGEGKTVISRIEYEHLKHGGKDNGRLPVTYEDFAEFGLSTEAAVRGVLFAEGLGFISVTVATEIKSNIRPPNLYSLGWLPLCDMTPAARTWQKFKTVEEAQQVVDRIKDARKRRPCRQRAAAKVKQAAPSGPTPTPTLESSLHRRVGATPENGGPLLYTVEQGRSTPQSEPTLHRRVGISDRGTKQGRAK
jgi:hypothetical protein